MTAFSPGARVGPYEVLALVDEGGMGQVYRGRDTRLERDVALKVLPEALVDDRERMARFEREAKLLASVSHPNIAAVYGLESSGSARALVMELIEGRPLSSILREGPMPVADSLPVAVQVCRALEAAHAQGIVHRDLKPGNVLVRDDGTVKVLDFGLAKVTEPSGRADESAMADSLATKSGMILGTPPYMSPEQLDGRGADPRTDVWAFGCLLYEMLAGRGAFQRSTIWQTVAAVLEQEADLDRLPTATPPRIRLLIERCLRKDPDRRLHHIADARIEIEEALADVAPSGRMRASPAGIVGDARPLRLAAMGIGTAMVVLAAAWAMSGGPASHSGESIPLSFVVPLPPGMIIGPGEIETYTAISPDGRRLAFVGNAAGGLLRIHDLETGATRPVPGTEGAGSPFWSPDGEFVAYFTDGRLERVGLEGQPPQVISDAMWEAGTAWNRDGVILFAQPTTDGIAIHRVSVTGGVPEPVTAVDPEREIAHFWPSFLSDGRHFLYLSVERSEEPVPPRTLYVTSLSGGEPKVLLSGVSRALHAAPGVLLYVRDGVLVGHAFDEERLELSGEPWRIAEDLRYFYMTGQAEFSVSQASTNPALAFHGGGWSSRIQRYTRSGDTLGWLADPAAFDQLRISPDGGRVVVDVLDTSNGGRDIWVYDLDTGRGRRLTLHAADEQDPVWSPDGDSIIYRSDQRGPPDLYVRSATGGGDSPQPLLSRPTVLTPQDWSRDGAYVLYQVSARTTGSDQWLVDRASGEVSPLLQTRYAEWSGRFSPAGRWVAFVSDESGGSEVYLAPVDDPGARRVVSSGGGIAPRWRRDGGELYYLGPDRTVMVATVGPEGETGAPRLLFELDAPVHAASWDVAPAGDQFLVNHAIHDGRGDPIRVLLNWPGSGGS